MIMTQEGGIIMGFSELVATVLGAGKQVGGVLSDKAKDARDYAKDATELAGLKKQITPEEYQQRTAETDII